MVLHSPAALRYVKVSVLIGILAGAGALALERTGIFAGANERMRMLLGGATTSVPGSAAIVVLLIISLGVSWAAVDLVRGSQKLILSTLVLLEIFTATVVLSLFGNWFSPFPAAAATVISLGLGLVYAQTPAGRRKGLLQAALGSRAGRSTFRALMESKEGLPATGEQIPATVVMCSAKLMEDEPVTAESIATRAKLLRDVAMSLREDGGYIEHWDARSIRALFGAPLKDSGHAAAACAAVLKAVSKASAGEIQIGMESGTVVAGTFNVAGETAFHIEGEALLAAGWLNAKTSEYGANVIVGPGLLSSAEQEIIVRPLELVTENESGNVFEIYELMAMGGEANEEVWKRSQAFWRGVIFMREGKLQEAAEAFADAQPPEGEDAVLRRFRQKIAGELGQGGTLVENKG